MDGLAAASDRVSGLGAAQYMPGSVKTKKVISQLPFATKRHSPSVTSSAADLSTSEQPDPNNFSSRRVDSIISKQGNGGGVHTAESAYPLPEVPSSR